MLRENTPAAASFMTTTAAVPAVATALYGFPVFLILYHASHGQRHRRNNDN